MLNIIIIGCGQIGSRHLQALSKLEESSTIHLIDSSKESLSVARERFCDVLDSNNPCKFELIDSDFHSLPKKADIAIIATSSSVRLDVLKKMYERCNPQYLILEKFLFDKLDDYNSCSSLIKKNKTIAWVNQWISSSYPFRRIASNFKNEKIQIDVYGNEWGLACNCVHFIDFFDYMTNYENLKVHEYNLDNEILPSKRSSYVEFTGELFIKSESGSSIKMTSKIGQCDDIINVNIASSAQSCNIKILNDRLFCSFKTIDKQWNETFKLNFQSETTGRTIQNIIMDGDALLPSYERSSYQHKLVFGVFEKHLMSNCGQSNYGCKIT